MMKFRRSRSSGSYSVNPPQGETGEVAYSVKGDKHNGKYTLIDKETMTLPNTPRMSFRESVRKSLRKLKRGKRNKDKMKTKKKESEAVYEVSMSYNTKVEVHEEKADDLENQTGEDQVILKEHSSRKPSFKREEEMAKSESNITEDMDGLYAVVQRAKVEEEKIKPKNARSNKSNRNSLLSEIANEVSVEPENQNMEESFKCFPEVSESQTFLAGKESTLLPRGPLGDLLKQKQHEKQNTVEQAIVHNETKGGIQDEPEYKVEHLEIGNLESKWVEDMSEQKDDIDGTAGYDMTITSKMVDSTSLIEKHKTPAIVIHTRPSASSAELSLRMDEIVFLHRRLNDSWYLGEKRGVMGLIPAAFIKIIVDSDPCSESVRALATSSYTKRSQAELDLKSGQLVYLTHRVDYHWYLAQAGGAKGLVPAAYLEIISSSSDGALPPMPAYTIKSVRKDAGDHGNLVQGKGDEEPDTGRRGRRRKSQGKGKIKDEGSVRNEIMKSISKRKEPILFV